MLSNLMKIAVLLATTAPAFANTLGIPDGEYQGTGVLHSENLPLPPMKFRSERKLENGTIEAHTKAYLLGHVVAEASAHLAVRGGRDGFQMIDLDNNSVAGSGRCDETACSFTATVMNGGLTLSETWVVNDDGFNAVNGYQDFGGKEASYEAQFQKTSN
jgi:hypothetical protein